MSRSRVKRPKKKKTKSAPPVDELQEIRDELAELRRRILNLEQEIRYLGERDDLT